MCKEINGNVCKLMVIFLVIIFFILIINLIYNDGVVLGFVMLMGLSEGLSFGLFSMDIEDINCVGFVVLIMLGGVFVMWIVYYVEYVFYQCNNFCEFLNFIMCYLVWLNDYFCMVEGQVKFVIVGQEKDVVEFLKQVCKWYMMVLWIVWCIFFIESFVCGVMFQILCNFGYYLVMVLVFFLVVFVGVNSLFVDSLVFDLWIWIVDLGLVFGFFFVVLIGVYVIFLCYLMMSIDEINQDEWIGFDSLLLDNVLGEMVGKYVEDVGYWKNWIGGSFQILIGRYKNGVL